MLSEPPGADPHAGWCGRGQGEPGLYPIWEGGVGEGPAQAPRRRRTSTRRGPAVGQALEHRQRGHAPEIINISWKAQRRLNARWRQLRDARHKPGGIVAVAVARELAAYCWEIATWRAHPDPVPPASLPAGDPLTQAAPLPPKQKTTTRRRITNSR